MRKTLLARIIVAGLVAAYPLQRLIGQGSVQDASNEESLYFESGKSIKRMSLGLDALAADVYWIRTVQYFGRKLIDSGKPLSSAATKDIRMDLLAPLLRIVVALDPHHIPAYSFAAIFLPERDMQAATELLEEGIRANPDEWRLYQDLAYVYWQAGNGATGDERTNFYASAAHWYDKGASTKGAPEWMKDLAGLMMMKGGSREAARAVYSAYLASDDENVRAQAIVRLKQVRSLDEIDAINAALEGYRRERGLCPSDLRALAPGLRRMKLTLNEESLPVDPDGFAYYFDVSQCKVEIAPESTVAR